MKLEVTDLVIFCVVAAAVISTFSFLLSDLSRNYETDINTSRYDAYQSYVEKGSEDYYSPASNTQETGTVEEGSERDSIFTQGWNALQQIRNSQIMFKNIITDFMKELSIPSIIFVSIVTIIGIIFIFAIVNKALQLI